MYDLSYLNLYLHYLRVYYELTTWPAPIWIKSWVARRLNHYRILNFTTVKLSSVYNYDYQSCHHFLHSCYNLTTLNRIEWYNYFQYNLNQKSAIISFKNYNKIAIGIFYEVFQLLNCFKLSREKNLLLAFTALQMNLNFVHSISTVQKYFFFCFLISSCRDWDQS